MEKNVTVRLLVDTYSGRPLKAGEILDVSSKVAERWVLNRIAEVVEPNPDPDPLDGMTVPELKAFAEGKGIDLAGATVKADIVATITAAIST